MLTTTTWEQTAIYNQNDPEQRERVVRINPGNFGSFYWNRVPDAGSLKGLGLSFTGLPQVAQIGIVAGLAAVAGYFAYSKYGAKVQRMIKARR